MNRCIGAIRSFLSSRYKSPPLLNSSRDPTICVYHKQISTAIEMVRTKKSDRGGWFASDNRTTVLRPWWVLNSLWMRPCSSESLSTRRRTLRINPLSNPGKQPARVHRQDNTDSLAQLGKVLGLLDTPRPSSGASPVFKNPSHQEVGTSSHPCIIPERTRLSTSRIISSLTSMKPFHVLSRLMLSPTSLCQSLPSQKKMSTSSSDG